MCKGAKYTGRDTVWDNRRFAADFLNWRWVSTSEINMGVKLEKLYGFYTSSSIILYLLHVHQHRHAPL
jgi:hypothetical protein